MTTKRGHPGEAIAKTVIRTLPIGVVGGEPTTWIAFFLLNNFWGATSSTPTSARTWAP